MIMPQMRDWRASAQASEWLVRLREEPDNEQVFNAWLRWREADPAHAVAYESMQQFWRQLDRVMPEAAEWDEAPPAAFKSRKRWPAAGLALAASCAAVICALLWITHATRPLPAPTAVRENRSSILPDGSAVDLGARTSVAVDFSRRERLLHLSQGEAYFKVKADPTRPFTVRVGPLDVTAVGTAFDVNRQASRTVVTVQEGMVAVKPSTPLQGSPAASWRVARGYQFIYSEREAAATLSSVDTSAVLAWREGRLEYTRAPLGAVLTDINRYADRRIELGDARVGHLTFTGTVFTDSIGDWVNALPGALPVTVRRGEGGTTILKLSGGGKDF